MKTRIKFSKCGSMRFVGHLDVMRYFQKAFRRAQIPVSYSQGFSPHQLMSFSSPLGIGLSSDGEYMDLTLDQVEDADRIVEQMNEQMNEEIRVRNLTILKDDARPSMAMLAACDYMIAAKPDKTSFLERVDLEELVHRFMEQSSITILKKTKRMIKEGREIAAIHPNMVVKIPMTVEGLKACKVLSSEGIKTNVTLIFSANQALLAARAGATYVSPFLGRLDDISTRGVDLIRDIADIFAVTDLDTQIIAASVRNPDGKEFLHKKELLPCYIRKYSVF